VLPVASAMRATSAVINGRMMCFLWQGYILINKLFVLGLDIEENVEENVAVLQDLGLKIECTRVVPGKVDVWGF